MTSNSDLSPEDVEKAQAIAPQLDPDMAQAIAQGNGPVIQAIASGATTTAQIADMLIRQGNTTGLPPGLQQLVAEQMRQNEEKRDPDAARADRRERTLADTLAAFATVGTTGGAAAASAETQARQMWQGVSSADIARLTYADWSGLSEPQKKALVDETKARAEDAVDYTAKDFGDEQTRIRKQMQAEGATEDQAIERMRKLMKAIYHDPTGAAINLTTPQGQDAAKANIDKLPPEDQPHARQLLEAAAKFAHADKARDHADAAKKPDATDQQQHKGVVGASGHIAKIEQNAAAYDPTNPAQHQQIVRSSDRAALEGDKLASTTGQKAHLEQAILTERQARTNERATIAAASLQAASGDGGFGADEPAPVVAQARPPTQERLSNDLTRLQQAGMVQLPGVTAQIASAPPEPNLNPAEQKPQKPEGSGPSGGGTPA
jgi:hypothetical protein